MWVLGLDTTGPDCSVCLTDGDTVRAYASERIGRGHAERLGPMAAEALAAAELAPTDVQCITVCTGPGSFTGLRVALSFAKGFALPRRIPVIGLNALSVVYRTDQPVGDQPKVVYRDVRRGQFMFALFGADGDNPQPQLGSIEDMQALARLQSADLLEAEFVDVRVMARLAANLDPADYPAEPLYARAPDAKLPGGVSL